MVISPVCCKPTSEMKVQLTHLLFQVWTRFVRFIAEDGRELCGQPEDDNLDGIPALHGISVYQDF